MIDAAQLRIGNYILHKSGVRILPVKCTFQHFQFFSKGLNKDAFPIALKPDILLKCGFLENKQYYLLPDAHEFVLTLPIIGKNNNVIVACLNSKQECYSRVTVNDLIISNHFYNVHQLQNIYYALLNEEMVIDLL